MNSCIKSTSKSLTIPRRKLRKDKHLQFSCFFIDLVFSSSFFLNIHSWFKEDRFVLIYDHGKGESHCLFNVLEISCKTCDIVFHKCSPPHDQNGIYIRSVQTHKQREIRFFSQTRIIYLHGRNDKSIAKNCCISSLFSLYWVRHKISILILVNWACYCGGNSWLSPFRQNLFTRCSETAWKIWIR